MMAAAGTDDGLRYRMLYLEPALALQSLGNRQVRCRSSTILSFADPVHGAFVSAALGNLDEELDELLVDDVVSQLTQGLARHARQNVKPLGALAVRQTRIGARLSRRTRLASCAIR